MPTLTEAEAAHWGDQPVTAIHYGAQQVWTPWDPATLVAGPGILIDASDTTRLWQDEAGTIPVTTDGDPVGRVTNPVGPDFTATGTITWRTEGGTAYLDITAGSLAAVTPADITFQPEWSILFAARLVLYGGTLFAIGQGSTAYIRLIPYVSANRLQMLVRWQSQGHTQAAVMNDGATYGTDEVIDARVIPGGMSSQRNDSPELFGIHTWESGTAPATTVTVGGGGTMRVYAALATPAQLDVDNTARARRWLARRLP